MRYENPEIEVIDNERLTVQIELMLVTARKFPARLLDGPAHEVQKQWMDRGVHPIGVIEQFDQMSILGIGPQRQLLALIGEEAYPIESPDAGKALFRALDQAGTWLWGHSWNSSLGSIFRINRRTTQRDRVAKNLLPPKVLYMVAHLASIDDGPAMAFALQAVAELDKSIGQQYRDEMQVRAAWQFAIDVYFGANDDGLQVVMKD